MRAAIAEAWDLDEWPVEAVACNLCGGTATTPIADHDRYGLPVTVVQCRSCELRYLNPRMTAAGYAAFYAHGYRPLFEAHRGAPLTTAELETDQRIYGGSLAHIVASRLPAVRSVLDVGGSTGIVGRAFRARWGCDVTVVDPSAVELARAEGCQQIHASAEAVETFPAVDLALLCRTVDHLLDPMGVLTRLARTSARLIVDAMHVEGWPASARYKIDHPYAFTAETFAAMVTASGWDIVQTWWRGGTRYVGHLCRPKEGTHVEGLEGENRSV